MSVNREAWPVRGQGSARQEGGNEAGLVSGEVYVLHNSCLPLRGTCKPQGPLYVFALFSLQIHIFISKLKETVPCGV